MPSNRKELRIRSICRGTGKVFSLATIPAEFQGRRVSVVSTLEDGTEVPVKVRELGSDSDKNRELIVTCAVLDVAQIVSLQVRGDYGEMVAEVQQKIEPRIAKLTSQVHTFLKDGRVPQVRNYDQGELFDEYQIWIARIIATPNEVDVVHGEVVCTSACQETLEQDLELLLFDCAGHRASIGECVVLRDTTLPYDESSTYSRRVIQFSFRIPRSLPAFSIWARPKGEPMGLVGGMSAFEPHVVQQWRDQWNAMALPAMVDPRYSDQYHARWEASPFKLEIQRHVSFSHDVKFSIVVPLFQTPVEFLNEMVGSVLAQSYGNFELILVNASPEDAQLSLSVSDWLSRDDRIRMVLLEENLGIAENTNAGISESTGDFVCFLDHDDTLAPDALYCYAKALEDYPTTDMFYSDEDHLENGVYKNPYFKPDLNIDLLTGMNYICHFMAIRASVLESIGAVDKTFDGAQDHYLALHACRLARNVFHCRRVLYHWRIHPGSTANNEGEKPYAQNAGLRAVQSYLDACGISAQAKDSDRAPGRYEVFYDMKDEPLVSILIPNKDAVPVLDRCLRSIREKTTYKNYEVVIIENNSTDEKTFEYYEEAALRDPRVRVVRYEGSFNYAKINNFGASNAQGDYYLLLNNDTEVISPHWIERMVSLCARPSTGIVGAKLLYPDNTIQHAGVMTLQYSGPAHINMYRDAKEIGPGESLRLAQDVSAVTGACLMTSAKVYEELGGMDEEFPVDYNDVDYCWKVRDSGRLVVFDPSVELYHYESVSRGFHPSLSSAISFERAKGRLRVKWPDWYAKTDPYGNPNFDQARGYLNLMG